jgi:hypothetical protein
VTGGEDIRASSATASSGRCALLRDTVPDQGEGRSQGYLQPERCGPKGAPNRRLDTPVTSP